MRLRRATGYALSIFIPVSCVCVLPYEAVRWALIGVATLTSGLFLLLNFRGPIFDVAGAKCALKPGVSGSVAERAFRAVATHVCERRPAALQPLGCLLWCWGEDIYALALSCCHAVLGLRRLCRIHLWLLSSYRLACVAA